jgi:hypothetical protein
MDGLFDWADYSWIPRERWGQIHPQKTIQWYDPSCVKVDQEGQLLLSTHKNPKYFDELGQISMVGIGLVSCTNHFSYGEFTFTAKLPYGKDLWPAIWLWSWDSWPPEIDLLEGYSDKNPNYFKFRLNRPLGFWNIQTNVHFTKGGKGHMAGPKTHWFGFKDPTQHFIEYRLIWLKDRLEFWYGGKRVRTIKDSLILEQLADTKMNLIINNGVMNSINEVDPTQSTFIIKDFKYNPA